MKYVDCEKHKGGVACLDCNSELWKREAKVALVAFERRNDIRAALLIAAASSNDRTMDAPEDVKRLVRVARQIADEIQKQEGE